MKRKRTMVFVVCALLAVVAAAAVVFAKSDGSVETEPQVVDLNDFAEVRLEGQDGCGYVTVSFDHEGFSETVWRLLTKNGELGNTLEALAAEDSEKELSEQMRAAFDMLACQSVHCHSDGYGLSNGEKYMISWEFDKAEEFDFLKLMDSTKVRLIYRDRIHVAEGLPSVPGFDAFSAIEMTFEGCDGSGKAVLNRRSDLPDEASQALSFVIFPEAGAALSNGDSVMVQVLLGMEESEFVEKYHLLPEKMTRVYTVSGLQAEAVPETTAASAEEPPAETAESAAQIPAETATSAEEPPAETAESAAEIPAETVASEAETPAGTAAESAAEATPAETAVENAEEETTAVETTAYIVMEEAVKEITTEGP